MTDRLAVEQLDALEVAIASLTPVPWVRDPDTDPENEDAVITDGLGPFLYVQCGARAIEEANGIVALRNVAPTLLAMARRCPVLEEECDRLRDARAHAVEMEREACALVAESCDGIPRAAVIAARIRSRGDAPAKPLSSLWTTAAEEDVIENVAMLDAQQADRLHEFRHSLTQLRDLYVATNGYPAGQCHAASVLYAAEQLLEDAPSNERTK